MQEYSVMKPFQASSKIICLLYYGNDQAAARAAQAPMRNVMTQVRLRDAHAFDGVAEHCTRVMIMSDVPDRFRKAIKQTYGDLVIPMDDPAPDPKPSPIVEKARETAAQLSLNPDYAAVRDDPPRRRNRTSYT
jgi:hypothetical protein